MLVYDGPHRKLLQSPGKEEDTLYGTEGMQMAPAADAADSPAEGTGTAVDRLETWIREIPTFSVQDFLDFKRVVTEVRKDIHLYQEDSGREMDLQKTIMKRLAHVISILDAIQEKHPALRCPDLEAARRFVVSFVREYSFNGVFSEDGSGIRNAVEALANRFSSRAANYLVNYLSAPTPPPSPTVSKMDDLEPKTTTVEEADSRLQNLEEGVEFGLRYAKVVSEFTKCIVTFVEKRVALEQEFSKSLNRLAQNPKVSIPLREVYCETLEHDIQSSLPLVYSNGQANEAMFLEKLNTKRAEQEKQRRKVKETWARETKKMQDTVRNLKKAKALYMQRTLEYQKIMARTDTSEDQAESKEKSRRVEEDASQKASEAETTYKACIVEANERYSSLRKVKREVLEQIQEIVRQYDKAMKTASTGYFQMHASRAALSYHRYKMLAEKCCLYAPGSGYLEEIGKLCATAPHDQPQEVPASPFVFEPAAEKMRAKAEPSDHRSADPLRVEDGCREGKQPLRAWTTPVSDSESAGSGHSNPDQDATSSSASPVTTCYRGASSGQLSGNSPVETLPSGRSRAGCCECPCPEEDPGVEHERRGTPCHRRRLERSRERTCHDIPLPIALCVSEIEKRGMETKGLYRVSAVKGRVEELFRCLEGKSDMLDLQEVHPNIISNVLKQYLRQMPDPLIPSKLNVDFVRVAKAYQKQPEDAVEKLSQLCAKIPRRHLLVLAFLVRHLKKIADAPSISMSATNLGVVFGPTLFRTVGHKETSMASLADIKYHSLVVQLMICYCERIFRAREDEEEEEGEEEEASRRALPKPSGKPCGLAGRISLARSLSLAPGRKAPTEERPSVVVSTPFRRQPKEDAEARSVVALPGCLADAEHPRLPTSAASAAADCTSSGSSDDDEFLDVVLPDESPSGLGDAVARLSTPRLRLPLGVTCRRLGDPCALPRSPRVGAKPYEDGKPCDAQRRRKGPWPSRFPPTAASRTSTDSSVDSDFSFDTDGTLRGGAREEDARPWRLRCGSESAEDSRDSSSLDTASLLTMTSSDPTSSEAWGPDPWQAPEDSDSGGSEGRAEDATASSDRPQTVGKPPPLPKQQQLPPPPSLHRPLRRSSAFLPAASKDRIRIHVPPLRPASEEALRKLARAAVRSQRAFGVDDGGLEHFI